MPKNYRQARKQREFAKKVRQEEKQQRRTARLGAAAPAPDAATPEGEPVPVPDATGRGTS